MPVTLAQAKAFMTEDVDNEVIDEFQKSSWLLENMTFDNVVGDGGGVLTFGYKRLTTESGAAFRAVNADYTPSEVVTTPVTGELKIFGGDFQLDRVFSLTTAWSLVTLNLQQKIKSARALFHHTAINGDDAVDAASFDGLNVILAGTSTEVSAAQVSADWTALSGDEPPQAAIDRLESVIALMDGPPTAILGNFQSIPKFASIARRAGYYDQSNNGFGQRIQRYGNVALVDLGARPGSSLPIIPTETRTKIPVGGGGAVSTTGLTDLYFVRLGEDGFVGKSLVDPARLVMTYLDEFDEAYDRSGSVKRGGVEMVAAVALMATRSAAVLRNVKVI